MNPPEKRSWEPFLRRVPLFAELGGSVLRRLASKMQLLSLPRGATLYCQGDEGDALYIIASGAVRLVNPRDGAEAVVAFMGRGDVLGEVGLLTGERRPVTVRLDTSCEFLKLRRGDFDELARENPAILASLTHMLSARLMAAGSAPRRAVPGAPQLVALNAAVEPDDRAPLTLGLALALVEQTRRRVLLVDMASDAGALAKALGLAPRLADEENIRGLDRHSPESVKAVVQRHGSGLEVLSLPASALGGRLYSGIYLFLNHLRESYDFVLAGLDGSLGDVERSVLAEADQVLLAGCRPCKALYRQLDAELAALVPDANRFVEAWLGGSDAEEALFSRGGRRLAVPWSGLARDRLKAGASPAAAFDAEPKAAAGLARLARAVGGIRVGLALGSGAALGYSLIGVLKVLKRERVPVDIVTGTSVGAVLGGFYALGMEPEEVEALALKVDRSWVFENFLWDLTFPRSGLFAGQTLLDFLRSYFGEKEFHDLELPFACLATDIETGAEVVLRAGRVAEAVRASCGLPLIFAPFRLGGRYLVDGGLVSPVPTRAAAALGADILLAVNLTLPAGARRADTVVRGRRKGAGLLDLPADIETLKTVALPEALRSPGIVDVFFQMIYTMEYEIARARTDPAHLVIRPEPRGFHWTEMHRAAELIAVGERAAEESLQQVKALIPFFGEQGKS